MTKKIILFLVLFLVINITIFTPSVNDGVSDGYHKNYVGGMVSELKAFYIELPLCIIGFNSYCRFDPDGDSKDLTG